MFKGCRFCGYKQSGCSKCNKCNKCNKCSRPACTRCHVYRPTPLPVVSPKACEECDGCQSNVQICSFTVKETKEVRKYRNSLVYSEEDNTIYWVDNEGVPVITYRQPVFKDDFDPTNSNLVMNTAYDFKNNKAYVFDPAGEYRTFTLVKEDK